MKKRCRVVSATLACSLLLVMSACGKSESPVGLNAYHRNAATAKVTKGAIVATASNTATVAQSAQFAVLMPQRGDYAPMVKVGDAVKPQQILAYAHGTTLVSPVAAIVRSVTDRSVDLPANYPVITLEYQGFSLTIDASTITQGVLVPSFSGRFQITDGVGPSQCAAVVYQADTVSIVSSSTRPPDEAPTQNAEQDQTDGAKTAVQPEYVTCLIGKDVTVRAGQSGVAVITSAKKEHVLWLPLSAVAGRTQKGKVTQIIDGKHKVVEVGLGISDGARVEITSGLNEGDTVVDESPDLVPMR